MGFWAAPIFKGDFPEIVRDIIGNRSLAQGFENSRLPIFSMEEKTMLKGSADFFGLNMYTSDLAQPLDFPIGKYWWVVECLSQGFKQSYASPVL